MIQIDKYRITSSNSNKVAGQPGSFSVVDSDTGHRLCRVYSPHSKPYRRACSYVACPERIEAEQQLREHGLSEETIKMIMSGE
jgi:hypothetical protein